MRSSVAPFGVTETEWRRNLQQTLSAVAKLEEDHIVHRDIKPRMFSLRQTRAFVINSLLDVCWNSQYIYG
jgi:serine/threonine protein kinase